MRATSTRTLLTRQQVLFPATRRNLANPLVYINEAKHTRLDELHDILPLYMAGPEEKDAVLFGQYPEPIYVDARQSFLASCGETLIFEQVPHHIHDRPQDIDAAILTLERGKPYAMTIDAPVVLVGRFGYGVWGHWLNEMLPKAVAVEAAFPGRFAYAVPAEITIPTPERSYCSAILESLAAYGIGPERLIRLPPGHVCKLAAAYDVAGGWQYGLHHDVARLMRSIVAAVPRRAGQRVMMMRHPADMRAIYNGEEIAHLLASEGFVAFDPRRCDFRQQAEIFAGADYVAGELGSNLSGLIYAPDGVRLLSFAPTGWIDAYFLYVMKALGGTQADVRGPTTHLRGADPQRSPFVIDPADARAGLAALAAAGRPGAPPFQAGGQLHPRAVGRAALHLRFGAGGNGHACLRGAWHTPEADHVWCAQDTAIIEVARTKFAATDHVLEIRGISVSYRDYMPARRLGVTVNGTRLVQTHVTGNARIMMIVPAAVLAERRRLMIEIDHPVIGPATFLGASGDTRALGIGLTDVVLYEGAGA
jgi:capsular polysaccharide biosynthesis protein